jgi:hypothetical protein
MQLIKADGIPSDNSGRFRRLLKASAEGMERAVKRSAPFRFACATVLAAGLMGGCGNDPAQDRDGGVSDRTVYDWFTKQEVPSASEAIDDACTAERGVLLKVILLDGVEGKQYDMAPADDGSSYSFRMTDTSGGASYMVVKESEFQGEGDFVEHDFVDIEGLGYLRILHAGEELTQVLANLSTTAGAFDFAISGGGFPPHFMFFVGEDGTVSAEEPESYRWIYTLVVRDIGDIAWGFRVDGTSYGVYESLVSEYFFGCEGRQYGNVTSQSAGLPAGTVRILAVLPEMGDLATDVCCPDSFIEGLIGCVSGTAAAGTAIESEMCE